MRHLLAKDLRLVAPHVWLIVPVHVLWCAQAFLVPDRYFWMSLSAACGWTVAQVMIEWQVDADRLLGSLPVTRTTVVEARYVSALAALALGAVLYVAYGYALTAVATVRVIERWHGTPGWASFTAVTAFLIVGYLLTVGFLPFYFRFGLPLGAAWFSVATAVASSGTLGLARLARGAEGVAGAGGAAAIRPFGGAVFTWLSSAATTWGGVPTALALVGLAAVVAMVSIGLSIRFYEERDL
jgi:hypothetical protein